jgi:hypothetical protein
MRRTGEREMLDGLLADVRGGQSAVLVIRGEAGIGKTALLRYAARQAAGFRVAQVTGVEAEMELPFAGTHQLCAPMLDDLGALPRPQRDALSVALGLETGGVPDRFLVGVAVLGLLSAVARPSPNRTRPPATSTVCPSFDSKGCWRTTRAPCSPAPSPAASTTACATASSPRPAVIRSLSWSCRST